MLGVPLPADQVIAKALCTIAREARDTKKKAAELW